MVIAARMRHAVLEMAMAHGGSENGVATNCAGVAAVRPHQSEDAADLLLREADRALYLAKNRGRSAVMIASLSGRGRKAAIIRRLRP